MIRLLVCGGDGVPAEEDNDMVPLLLLLFIVALERGAAAV